MLRKWKKRVRVFEIHVVDRRFGRQEWGVSAEQKWEIKTMQQPGQQVVRPSKDSSYVPGRVLRAFL